MAKTDTNTQPSLITQAHAFSVTIPWTEAEKAYNETLKKVAPRVKVAGFRKGKVPSAVAEKHVDPSYVIEQALQKLLPNYYPEALEKQNKKVVGEPAFKATHIEMGSDWVIEARVAEATQVDLKSYEKLVKKGKEAGKKAVEEKKKELAEAHKTKSEKKPKDAPADEKSSEAATVSEAQERDIVIQHIYKELISELKPQVTDILVEQEVRREINYLAEQLKRINKTVEEYLQHQNVSQDQFLQDLSAQALTQWQLTFILSAIAEKEKLEVTDTDIDTYLDEIAQKAGAQSSSYKDNKEYRSMVKNTLSSKKLTDHLLSL